MSTGLKTQLAVVLLISLISINLHGYSFSSGDQAIYLPQIYKLLDSTLFSKDYAVNLVSEARMSLFFPLMATIIRGSHVDIQWLYFCLYTIIHFFVIWAVYRFSLQITNHSITAVIASFLLAIPRYVGGTTITTLDTAWLPRFFILPIFLLGCLNLYKNYYYRAAFLAGIILLFHPFSSLILNAYILGCLIGKPNFKSTVRKIFFVEAIFGLMLLRSYSQLSTQDPIIMPQNWFEIIKSRVPYNLLFSWRASGWASLLITICVVAATIRVAASTSQKQFYFRTIMTAFAISIIATIAEITKITPIIELQALRVWVLPTYLTYISVAQLAMHILSRPSLSRLFAASAILGLFFTNFGRALPQLKAIEYPGKNTREWDQIQIWAHNHTPKDSLFLTPAQRVGFRVHSQRSIVAEIKDGSSGLYSYNFAKSWVQRIGETHPLATKTTAEIIQLNQKYQADYFVTFTEFPHPMLIEAYRTLTFVVYKF